MNPLTLLTGSAHPERGGVVGTVDVTTIALVARRHFRDAWQHRWFTVFAISFAALALALSASGFLSGGTVGIAGFGRTAASLVNLVLLFVPQMGLSLGALSIAPEREQGTLETLLAQPVTTTEVLLGKWLGLAGALTAVVTFGFGINALVIAFAAPTDQLGGYLVLSLFTLLLGWASLSVGILVSVASSKGSTAISWALFLWLAIVLLGDLGMLGTALVLRLSPPVLLWLTLLNPAQQFRIAVLHALQGNLELLGAAGMYAADVFGRWLVPLLGILLVLWDILPLFFAAWLFARKGGG